jgi:hypothetical protein
MQKVHFLEENRYSQITKEIQNTRRSRRILRYTAYPGDSRRALHNTAKDKHGESQIKMEKPQS